MSSAASLSGGKYTRDLKLRVLEHYFRNGGEYVFGNKQSTAKKFGVDNKTINRFLKIPDLVRAARKNARANKSTGGSSGGFKEPQAPGPSSTSRTRPPPRQSVRITLPSQPDESIVNQTADGNISSIGKLLKIFELGTQEIRDLLAAECDLIYECRVCRALFRSVANLLTHKRRYCTRGASETRHIFGSGPGQSLSAPSDGVMVLPIPTTIERLPEVHQATVEEARAVIAEPVPPVRLERLPGTGVAVVQTVGDAERSVGERLEEVRRMEERAGRTVKLGRDGRVVEGEEVTEEEERAAEAEGEDERHVCHYCNTTFSTRKTLSHHIRSLHSSTRIYYPCCLCSAAFINMFSVERHLQKVHKKKQDEIEVLKEGIKQKSFHRSVTEPQAAAGSASPNMPLKVGPPPAGLLRCAECRLCYPSAQLLAAHQLTAHARAAEHQTDSSIQARNDYLLPQTAPETLAEMADAAAAARLTTFAPQASMPPPPPPPPPPVEPSAEPAFVSETDMATRLTALSDLKRMRCRQCGSTHKTAHNLRRHVAGHIGYTRHGCPRCTHRYYTRFDVIKHMKRVHKVTARQAEELLRRYEKQQKAEKKSARGRKPAEQTAAEAVAEAASVVEVNEEPVEETICEELSVLPRKVYEIHDLTVPRSSSPATSSDRLSPLSTPLFGISPSQLPYLQNFRLLPPSSNPLLLSSPHHFSPSLHPQASSVAPPPTLVRRRPGRKNLNSIIHYIRSFAEPSSSDPGGSSTSDIFEMDIFQEPADTASGLTAILERPKDGVADEDEVSEVDEAAEDVEDEADGDADDDDDLEEFMSLSCGAELEPGAVWRTLPPLVPILSAPAADVAEAPSPSIFRRHPSFQRLSDVPQRHDCNENIEHRLERGSRTPPVGSKSFPTSPQRRTLSPHPQKYPSDDLNFFPRVLLTDIALRRWNSSPTPARPASPGGSAVYPAGARLDPTAATGEPDSPERKSSPSGAASASGGVSPNGVEQENQNRAPQPLEGLKKGHSDTDLHLVDVGENQAAVAATAAGSGVVRPVMRSSQSPDGRPKELVKSLQKGQRSVSAPGRVTSANRASAPHAGSPERSPKVSPVGTGRRGRRKANPGAAGVARRGRPRGASVRFISPDLATANGGAATANGKSPTANAKAPTPVPYVPSVWPPLVRKRSWSTPDPPDAVITAAESVKRRRQRRQSDRAGAT